MKPDLNTRKPVHELTEADLNAYPLWEYALDEEDNPDQDETWVRPVDSQEIPKDEYSQLVATDFTMSDGTNCLGFADVTTAEQPVSITPCVLFFNGNYCCLPTLSRPEVTSQDCPWDIESRDQLLRVTQKPEQDIFPLSFSLRIPVAAEESVRTGKVK